MSLENVQHYYLSAITEWQDDITCHDATVEVIPTRISPFVVTTAPSVFSGKDFLKNSMKGELDHDVNDLSFFGSVMQTSQQLRTRENRNAVGLSVSTNRTDDNNKTSALSRVHLATVAPFFKPKFSDCCLVSRRLTHIIILLKREELAVNLGQAARKVTKSLPRGTFPKFGEVSVSMTYKTTEIAEWSWIHQQ